MRADSNGVPFVRWNPLWPPQSGPKFPFLAPFGVGLSLLRVRCEFIFLSTLYALCRFVRRYIPWWDSVLIVRNIMGPRKAPVEVNWPFLCKTCTCAPLHLILFLPMASNADSRRPSRHRSRLRSTPAVTPQGVTPSSSARNVRRRTTRSSSSSGASNNHLVTPTPQGVTLSSIRDTARNPTRGTGQRSNDRYTREYSHYQSIVASQEGAPASPLRADTDDGVVFGPASTAAGNVPAPAAPAAGPDTPLPPP
jgi:hypothetical protein